MATCVRSSGSSMRSVASHNAGYEGYRSARHRCWGVVYFRGNLLYCHSTHPVNIPNRGSQGALAKPSLTLARNRVWR
jgi:hypothetical protein